MKNETWIAAPTKKQALFFGILGITGTVLLLLSMTNFLTESPFKGKHVPFFLLLFSTVATTITVIRNYLKQRKKN